MITVFGEEKWKPLMERTDAELSTGDADIVALALAPQVFAVSAVGGKIVEYGGNMVEFLENTGLDGMIKGLLPSGVFDKSDYEPEDEGMSILEKLSALFIGGVAGATFIDAVKKSNEDSEKKLQELKKKEKVKTTKKLQTETYYYII